MADWVTEFSTFHAPDYYLEANADDCAVWEPDQQCFRLTCHAGARYGIIIQRVESSYAVQEAYSLFGEFAAEFDFMIDGSADGIVFAWSDDPLAGGGRGGSLGWGRGRGYGVELDCHNNPGHNDPSGTHIALMHDGVDDHLAYADAPSIQDGNWHTVGVYKSGNLISVHYDGAEVFNHTLVNDDVAGGRFRFSAATGAVSAGQYVDNIQILCAEQSVSTETITWGGIKQLFR